MADEEDMDTELTALPGIVAEPRQEAQDAPRTASRSIVAGRHIQDPGSKIRSLKCFVEVDQRIRKGEFLRNVVHYIQDEMGELTKISPKALMYLLRQYKDYVFSDDAILDGIPTREEDAEDPFYELHSLQRHYRAMENRINMEVETETALQKLFSTTHKEYMQLLKMGKEILDRKAKLGLLNRERGGQRQRVGSGQPGRLDIANIVANPESRQRVLSLIEAMVGDPKFLDSLDKVDMKEETEKKVEKSRKMKHKHKAPRIKKKKAKKMIGSRSIGRKR